ncbi:unnamed protein product [Pedinophyceae sp. YPF-701]|nr:unnamed protein product [Pedinophyceae sp. YPF-701]
MHCHTSVLGRRHANVFQDSRIRPARRAARHPRASEGARRTQVRAAPADSPLPAETDYVVIGSGFGGLCCAALLAKYGNSVTVLESHYLPGGCAHSFEHEGYTFEAGPSFHAGLSAPFGRSSNPVRAVLDYVGETVPSITYDEWIAYLPEGQQMHIRPDARAYAREIERLAGPTAANEWRALERELLPLGDAAAGLPAAALRYDVGIVRTAATLDPLELLKSGLSASKLTGPFSALVDKHVSNPWLRKVLDLECFLLSGLTAKDTILAEMAFMFSERHSGKSTIDYPVGGTAAMIDALVRGLENHGGELRLRSHVEEIVVDGGRATGVKVRGSKGGFVRARKAVISNATTWDTQRLLPSTATSAGQVAAWSRECKAVPPLPSFVHLHLGISGEGLSDDLLIHHLAVEDMNKELDDDRNVVNISIPSVLDKECAPDGKHAVHVYCAANEDYAVWEGLKPSSGEYKALKRERSDKLYAALERVIPDVRSRVEVELIGTPLTHERFTRRHRGTYGPAQSMGLPGAKTPIEGLLVCGDSTQPGVGVPAAAASGMLAANTLSPVDKQLDLIETLRRG